MRTEYLIYFRGVFDKAIFEKTLATMFVYADIYIKHNTAHFCQLSLSKYRPSYIKQLFDKLHNSKVVIKTTYKKRTQYTTLKDFTCR